MLSTYYLLNDGTVRACGLNNFGQLGIGNTTNQTTLVQPNVSNVKQIYNFAYDAGTPNIYTTVFFLLNDGTVKACGHNGFGQLGVGNTTNQTTPVTVPISNVKGIYGNGITTYFLLNDGTVKACGYNVYGQLGIGNTTNRSSPVTVPVSNVKKIACGSCHVVFLLNDGTVKACGYNGYGQLGIGNTTNQAFPVTVNITGVCDIICGPYNTFFMLNDGTVKACGKNDYGQLGVGNTTNQASPVTVLVNNVRQVFPSIWRGEVVYEYYCATTFFLLNDDTVYGCGYNYYGELGIGSSAGIQYTPVKVPVPPVQDIIYFSTFVIMKLVNGNYIGIGANGFGQLGIGSTGHQLSPVQLSIPSDCKKIMVTDRHTVVIGSDKIYVAGYNEYGQLGTGDTYIRTTFTPITSLSSTDVKNIKKFNEVNYPNISAVYRPTILQPQERVQATILCPVQIKYSLKLDNNVLASSTGYTQTPCFIDTTFDTSALTSGTHTLSVTVETEDDFGVTYQYTISKKSDIVLNSTFQAVRATSLTGLKGLKNAMAFKVMPLFTRIFALGSGNLFFSLTGLRNMVFEGVNNLKLIAGSMAQRVINNIVRLVFGVLKSKYWGTIDERNDMNRIIQKSRMYEGGSK